MNGEATSTLVGPDVHHPNGSGSEATRSARLGLPRRKVTGDGPGIRRGSRRKWAIGGISLVAAVAAVAVATRPAVILVEVASLGRGPLEVTIEAEGTTRVAANYRIAAPVGGRLLRVGLREGDVVRAGDVVARIEAAPLDVRTTSEARARLEAAQAGLEEARARVAQTRALLEQAERTASRIATLVAAGAMSLEAGELAALEAETAGREDAAASSRVAASEAELEAARRALLPADGIGGAGGGITLVRAPTGGRVLRVHEPSERVVGPGTPIVDLAEARQLEIVADVLSTEAVRVVPGAPMHVVNWGGTAPLEARVRSIEPAAFTKVSALSVEEQRVRVVGDLLQPAPELGDGYRVEVGIVTWSAPDVLKVPVAALFRTDEGWGVFVASNGRARLRALELGARATEEAEVLGGLEEGDVVILYPSDELTNGARIRNR